MRIVCITLLALLGCLPARAAESAEDRLNSCALLASDEVAAAFEQPFEEGQLQEHGTEPDENYFSICVFSAANDLARPTFSITARRAPSITDPAASLQEHIEDIRNNAMPDFEMDPVPELGEGAGWSPIMGQLTVLRPGLMITAGAVANDQALAPILALTKIALDRLRQE